VNHAILQSNLNRYDLHCPICGDNTLQRYLQDESVCIHVVYIVFGQIGEIDHLNYLNVQYEGLFEDLEIYEDALTLDKLTLVCAQMPKSILHLTIETDTRTIGPMTESVRLGFDFDVVQPRSILSWSER
jgi:hypothetical protein